jgi:broad specificity phosphatase PhoE
MPRPAAIPLALALALVLALPAAAGPLEALRGGGHVLFLRHAETGPPHPDQLRAVIGECDTQRDLNAEGRAQAKRIGAALAGLGAPIGMVKASPFCRTIETAALAFGRAKPDWALTLPAHTGDAAAQRAMGEALLGRIAATPPSHGNLVLVGHGYHVRAAFGVLPEQGGGVVLRRGPGAPEVVGVIAPGDWAAPQQVAAAR